MTIAPTMKKMNARMGILPYAPCKTFILSYRSADMGIAPEVVMLLEIEVDTSIIWPNIIQKKATDAIARKK